METSLINLQNRVEKLKIHKSKHMILNLNLTKFKIEEKEENLLEFKLDV